MDVIDSNGYIKTRIYRSGWENKSNIAVMQSDGNFVYYNQRSVPIWATGTVGNGNRLVLGNDALFRIYNSSNKVLYTSSLGYFDV